MKKVILYSLWVFFYVLCMVLGYTVPPETHGAQHAALTFLSLAFFVPPVLLLIDAYRKKEQKTFRILRTVSILSLALTFGALLLNVMSAAWPEAVGDFLYEILFLVSVPMATMGNWLVSLFLWACLLFATFPKKKAAS